MKRLHSKVLIVFLLFVAVNVSAQGDVTVHSDPRLSLLLKKSRPVLASSAKAAAHKVGGSTAMRPVADAIIVHPAEILTAPHPGGMPVHNSNVKPPAPMPPPASAPVVVKPAPPMIWAPKHNVRTIYSGKGFRVQIYRGLDRSKAMEIKNEFARNNPGMRTYLSYVSPCFRVKVGNFRRRSDAEGTWREANSTYNPSMIVPDIITITTIE